MRCHKCNLDLEWDQYEEYSRIDAMKTEGLKFNIDCFDLDRLIAGRADEDQLGYPDYTLRRPMTTANNSPWSQDRETVLMIEGFISEMQPQDRTDVEALLAEFIEIRSKFKPEIWAIAIAIVGAKMAAGME